MIRTLVFTAALALGQAAFVCAPAVAAPAGQLQAEARAEVLLGRLVAYSQPHQTTLLHSTELVNFATTGVDQAIDMYESGSKDSSWFQAWEQALRTRAAAVRAEIAALPPFPREAASELLAGTPGVGKRIQGFERVGKEGRAAALANVEFAEQLIPIVRQVAVDGADEEALVMLAAKLTGAARLSIRADMTLLEASVSAGAPDHPQTALSLAMLANYRPADRLLAYQEAVLNDGQPDTAPLAAALRKDVAEARREAARTMTEARRVRAGLTDIADVSLRGNLDRAMRTYDESAAVELKIASRVETLAIAIEGGADPMDAMEGAFADIDPWEQERATIHARRLGALAK